jgi:MoaA/NifB/PqqE/SkfB family radical SAM enzyme
MTSDDEYDEVEGLKLAYERAKGIKREQKINNISNMTVNINATISNIDEIEEYIENLQDKLANMKINLSI